MSVLTPSEGRRQDWPQIEVAQIASAAAGSAADFSTIIAHLPDKSLWDLPLDLNEGKQSQLPYNFQRVRQASFVNNAANRAGVAANNFDWQLRLYRKGVLQGVLAYYSMSVNTTVATAVTATGVQAATPASMAGINPGSALYVDSAGTPELVYVISTTSTTFTANFTKTHSASFAVTSEMLQNWPVVFVPARAIQPGATLPAITAGSNVVVTPNAVNGLSGMYGIHVGDWLLVDTVASGVQETVLVTVVTATQFTATFANTHGASAPVSTTANPNNPGAGVNSYNQQGLSQGDGFTIQGGDVLVLTRLSNNATGLASDAGIVQLEWVPAKVSR